MHHRKRLFSHDPVSKITTWWHDNDTDDVIILEKEQDVTELIAANKAEYDAHIGMNIPWGDWAHVARFPMALHNELQRTGKLYDKAYMTRMLNSSEWRCWRTRPGRITMRLEK